jgi:hypothetical protein
MSIDLRPLTLAELLDRSFGLYRRYFWPFVGIMVVPSILMLIVSVGFQFLSPPNPGAPGGSPDPQQVISFAIWSGLVVIFGSLVYWVTYAIALGASTVAVSQLYRNERITIAGAYAPIRGQAMDIALLLLQIGLRIGMFTVAAGLVLALMVNLVSVISPILGVLVAFAGVFGLFGVWVWMALRYSVAVPVVVLEDLAASESIARSIELTKGNLGRVFVVVLFAVIVAYAAMTIFQGPFVAAAIMAGPETTTGFWLNLTGVLSGSVASAFTGPLVIIALAVLYYDLRIRKEGLDLQVMISDLGRRAPEAPAVLPG